MKLPSAFISIGLFVSLGVLATTARADVITSTLALPSSSLTSLFGVGNANAQQFQINPQPWSLTSIVIRAGNLVGDPTIFAELRADDPVNNDPVMGVGNVITTFTIPSLSGAPSDRTFLPANSVTLNPNKKYWFVFGTLSSETTGQVDWAFADVNGPVTGPGTVPPRFALTLDAGNSWSGFNNTPFLIQVNGTALSAPAPEPSAIALLIVAAGPAAGIIVRRRRSAQ
jgi:hypothetical protein